MAPERNVFRGRELGMEARADFEKGCRRGHEFRPSGGGLRNAGENFEESGLQRPLRPMDRDCLPTSITSFRAQKVSGDRDEKQKAESDKAVHGVR